jgi:hypothetical protein
VVPAPAGVAGAAFGLETVLLATVWVVFFAISCLSQTKRDASYVILQAEPGWSTRRENPMTPADAKPHYNILRPRGADE